MSGFLQRPEIHGNLALLNNRLPGSADIVVAGGAIRNVIMGDYNELCKYPSYDAYLAGRALRS
ncbi:hypothetical protein [Desulfosarcina sp.]|uniref:hypothetical protein n=1 Tax=Desulfosarcina sp. TaxID=2027861 RepID=UPI003562F78D